MVIPSALSSEVPARFRVGFAFCVEMLYCFGSAVRDLKIITAGLAVERPTIMYLLRWCPPFHTHQLPAQSAAIWHTLETCENRQHHAVPTYYTPFTWWLLTILLCSQCSAHREAYPTTCDRCVAASHFAWLADLAPRGPCTLPEAAGHRRRGKARGP